MPVRGSKHIGWMIRFTPRGCLIRSPKTVPSSTSIILDFAGRISAGCSKTVPHDQLIIDNSQALLTPPADGLATIYSPRKFVGVPDGGLLVTAGLEIRVPEHEDTGSVGRMRHLLLRTAYTAQDGYRDYLESEDSLSDTRPLRMSRLTRRMLAGIDMAAVKRQRRENFMALAARLDKYNSHQCALDAESVPLCYPLIVGWDVERVAERPSSGRASTFRPTGLRSGQECSMALSINWRIAA